MSVFDNLRQRLEKVNSDEEVLEKDIKEGKRSKAVQDSKQILNEIEELDENFVKLLLSDDAKQAVETAQEIVEWEKELAEFLNNLEDEIDEVKTAVKSEDHEKFNKAVNKIRRDIKKLRARRSKINIDQETEEAILLLVDLNEIEKEMKWFEKAVKMFDNEESIIQSSIDSEDLKMERQEIEKIKQNMPKLESQIHKLEDAVEKHNQVQIKSFDLIHDFNILSLKSLNPQSDREKAELEYLISLFEEMEEISQSYKDTSTRRGYLIKLIKLGGVLTAGGSGTAKIADDIPRIRTRGFRGGGSDSGPSLFGENKISMKDADIHYAVERKGDVAEMEIEIRNTSREIITLMIATVIPKSWDVSSNDMVFYESTDKGDELRNKLHMVPDKTKKIRLKMSNIDSETKPKVQLRIQVTPKGGNPKTKTKSIEIG